MKNQAFLKNILSYRAHPYPQNTVAGNALFIILVVIILLAALTFTLSRMNAKSSGNISAEQAQMMAEHIMRAAFSYDTAIGNLISGHHCSENELNFKNNFTTQSYDNTNAPADGRCDLYNPAGAGLLYKAPDENDLDSDKVASAHYGDWVFNASQCVIGIGDEQGTCTDDSEADLLIILPYLRRDVCLAINRLQHIDLYSNDAPEEDLTGLGFVGNFSNTDGAVGDVASGENLVKKTTGCLKDSGGDWGGSYVFYHVIFTR